MITTHRPYDYKLVRISRLAKGRPEYVAAIALSKAARECGRIEHLTANTDHNSKPGSIRFNRMCSSTIVPIGLYETCIVDSDSFCIACNTNHSIEIINAFLCALQDGWSHLNFSEAGGEAFALAILDITEQVRQHVPNINQLAVMTELVRKFQLMIAHDEIAAEVRPVIQDYRTKFAIREVGGMAELEQPLETFRKLSMGAIIQPPTSSAPSLVARFDTHSTSASTFSPSAGTTGPRSYTASTASSSSAGDLLVLALGDPSNTKALDESKACFEDAQKHLPADAVLVVGNLPAGHTDHQLMVAVANLFRSCAACFVTIVRMHTKHGVEPHALVQFYTSSAATFARAGATGSTIGGRVLHVEQSLAKRSVCVRLSRGGVPHPAFVAQCLGGFGHIKEIRPRVGGVYVEYTCFGTYLAAREALRAGRVGHLRLA